MNNEPERDTNAQDYLLTVTGGGILGSEFYTYIGPAAYMLDRRLMPRDVPSIETNLFLKYIQASQSLFPCIRVIQRNPSKIKKASGEN